MARTPEQNSPSSRKKKAHSPGRTRRLHLWAMQTELAKMKQFGISPEPRGKDSRKEDALHNHNTGNEAKRPKLQQVRTETVSYVSLQSWVPRLTVAPPTTSATSSPEPHPHHRRPRQRPRHLHPNQQRHRRITGTRINAIGGRHLLEHHPSPGGLHHGRWQRRHAWGQAQMGAEEKGKVRTGARTAATTRGAWQQRRTWRRAALTGGTHRRRRRLAQGPRRLGRRGGGGSGLHPNRPEALIRATAARPAWAATGHGPHAGAGQQAGAFFFFIFKKN